MTRGTSYAAAAALVCLAGCGGAPAVTVASKSFTESVVLGEMLAALIRGAGLPVEHRRQLGGTEVVFRALEIGAVDVYPEYTGTLTKEILRDEVARRPLAEVLAARGIRQTRPLGFDNSYALAMTEARAAALGVRRISDLGRAPRPAHRAQQRGDEPRRRLARPARPLRAAPRRARLGPRPRLPGARQRWRRRHRCLHDRPRDPRLQAARARGRQALLHDLRGAAPLPRRSRRARARCRGRDRAARREARQRDR